MSDQHIASAFDRDLEAIQAQIMRMGGLVEHAINQAAKALEDRDEELAEIIRKEDKAIDALEEQINEDVARVLAIRAPMGQDLRVVLSVLKISANLERVGDYAKNIAKRTGVIAVHDPINGTGSALRRMAREVEVMLKDTLDAYIRRDEVLAEKVRQRDQDVDQMYNGLFRQFLTHMMEDQQNITMCMHMHFIAKNIERMGDHVTSVADQVIYLVTGSMPEEGRPKGNSAMYETKA